MKKNNQMLSIGFLGLRSITATKKYFVMMVITFFGMMVSCVDSSPVADKCVKGKFLGTVPYCGGNIIQILDGTEGGKTWRANSGLYENCFAASLDSIFAKNATDPFNLQGDSIFFFIYSAGGYPRTQYVACEPESFITIKETYLKSCTKENLK